MVISSFSKEEDEAKEIQNSILYHVSMQSIYSNRVPLQVLEE